jgi:hypothetical protein
MGLGLLRTTFALQDVILSEHGSSSDNFFSSGRDFVRTRVIFGQLFLFSAMFCPNLGLLRTTFPLQHGILSEYRPTSDNFPSPARDFVRTRVIFGQLFLFSTGFCPNLGHLRTTFPLQREVLSEPGPTSDNFFSSARDFVRTRTIFGQLFLFSTRFCPNLGHLRTTFSLQHEILSEPGAPSDNFFSSARDFVRTWGTFGQLFLHSTGFCPNPGHLRTTFSLQHGILSEPVAT